ncbi:type II toxin-antitoxin system Phd/YefM family antitoxin [Tomitella fengzijianii]
MATVHAGHERQSCSTSGATRGGVKVIGVRELRQYASRCIAEVATGEEITVTNRGRAVARTVPVAAVEQIRDDRCSAPRARFIWRRRCGRPELSQLSWRMTCAWPTPRNPRGSRWPHRTDGALTESP